MRRAASTLVFTLMLVGLLTSASTSVNSYTNVSVLEAKQMIDSNPSLVILDVRTQQEYDGGHIQNATLIPVSELAGRLGELEKDGEILVYCAAGGRSATASQTLVDNGFSKVYNILGGISAWKSAGYWIEIVHNGDLVVDGTQTFVIENCTYMQTGNIYVRDYARLTIRNVALTMNQTYGMQYRFEVGNMATLEMTNLTVSGEEFGLACMDNSRVTISDSALWHRGRMFVGGSGRSEISISNSIGQIALSGDCEVVISNSSFRIEFLLDSNQIGTLEGLKPSHYDYWSLHQNQTGVNVGFALTLVDTTIEFWFLRLNYDATIVLSNSAIGILWLDYFETTATIHELHPGFYENWAFNNVTLKDSSVDVWSLAFVNSSAEIKDTEANILANGNSTISVLDSDKLGFDGISNFYGVAFFNRSSFNIGWRVLESNFYIFGNVTRVNTNIESWVSSNVTRNYNVIAKEMDGSSMENVTLTLFDKNSTLVWNGTTDSMGKADFNVTFTDSNHTDTLRLEAVKGNLSATASISFLSDTPVILALGAHDIAATDIAPSKTIVGQNYLALIMVTVRNLGTLTETFNVTAYYNETAIPIYEQWPNSTQLKDFWSMGDVDRNCYIDYVDIGLIGEAFNWIGPPGENPADINSDGKVNMLDLSECGQNFGKDIWTRLGIPYPALKNQTLVTQVSGDSTIVTFRWNTTGVAKGIYTIKAYATPVPGETDTADNNLTDGLVYIGIPGDINGDANVDIYDALLLSGAYNSRPSSPNWSPNADINGDNIVDIYDAILLANNYGKTA